MLDKPCRMASQFDILHFHIDQFHFPIFHDQSLRALTTLHGRQDLPDLKVLYDGFPEMPLVSISEAQRKPIPNANFVGTVLHGIPRDLFAPTLLPRGGYLAFLGRISPEKRVDRAIAVARAVGLPLKIAAKVDRVDEAYFRREIAPLLSQPGVEFIGEVDERQKASFLGDARALLFPIDWPEPFGLVMIESLACGVPVVAFRGGSVPEVIDHGVTGFLVDTVEEAIDATRQVHLLDRRRCRAVFERRFSVSRMTADHVELYQMLAGHKSAGEVLTGAL
jgi:glycosyltransferase involved in cell wall biosynthesis